MKHIEESRFSIIDIVFYEFIRLCVPVINGDLSATIKNGGHFGDLREVDPDTLGNGEGDIVGIGDAVLVMKFRANPVDAVFLGMKIIKTAFKPDNQE